MGEAVPRLLDPPVENYDRSLIVVMNDPRGYSFALAEGWSGARAA
jgi:hypothetical protein